MKKVRKSLPLLMVFMFSMSAVLLGSGCQIFSQQPTPQDNADQAPQDRRIGVIQSLGGVSTSNQGTNLLTMDDGSTILLRSAAINLDDPSYASKKVEVGGVITYTTDNKQIMEVENIDVLDNAVTSTQMQVQAPIWVDYVNAGLNFRVKYRNDFQLAENGQMITFTRPVAGDAVVMNDTQESASTQQMATQHVISIQVTSHDASQSLVKDFLKLPSDTNSALMSAGLSKSKIGMDGIDAYKSVSASNVTFSFDSTGNFYQIIYSGGSDSQNIDDQNIFYDFLASFQLLNAPPSTQQSFVTPLAPTVTPPAPTPAPAINSTTSSSSSLNSGSSSDLGTSASAGSSASRPSTSGSSVNMSGVSYGILPSSTQDSSSTATTDMSSSTGGTQQLLPGFSSFVSTGYKFTLEYPKNWYYGQSSTSDTTVVRHYTFGSQPVDQTPGNVNLDIVSGSIPSGANYTVGDKSVTMTTESGVNTYYYQDAKGRIYRVSGPSADDSSLRNMLSTLQEQ